MAENFVGEIRLFGFDWAPKGWALCNGQSLSVMQNQALFSLLGVQFGGNGTTTFNLPDLRSRVPAGSLVGVSPAPGLTAYATGTTGGAENVTLTDATVPQHNHYVVGVTSTGTASAPANLMPSSTVPNNTASTVAYQIYGSSALSAVLNGQVVGPIGGGVAHPNIQPYAAVNFSIALVGIYPSRP
ncbi:phage tail protein [Caulobacter sp. FWC2]|uniref:phage tail protein n=1 Tax=Caulobacter sp. FWC2 TaxID=69664 RepID=UPI000C15C0C8|nr:tail fiber protein [Caulobacter sp. FWC2]PIB92133.1 microcystin-dependent protein [Caulobacter sp. FWC2]